VGLKRHGGAGAAAPARAFPHAAGRLTFDLYQVSIETIRYAGLLIHDCIYLSGAAMFKILVPIDGSDCALRALNTAITMAGQHAEAELHLRNAPLPILAGHARMFLNKQEIQDYYNEE